MTPENSQSPDPGDRTPAAVMTWSTEGVPVSQRLEYWTQAISGLLFAMDVSTDSRADFRSFVTSAPLDALNIASLGGSQRVAARTAHNIRRSSGYSYHLVGNFFNAWGLNWADEKIRLEPGDLVMTDLRLVHSSIPLSEEIVFQRISIKLPPQWLAKWLRRPDSIVGRRISCKHGWGKVLSAYVRQLRPETALRTPVAPRLLADQLGSLLSLVEAEMSGLAAAGSAEASMTAKIIEVIRLRSCEPTLAAADVASTLGISKRTLHRHLSASGKTFATLLQDSRAEEARAMLESSNARLLTTAEIGFRAGFADPSYFGRVMRTKLNQSPATYRKQFAGGFKELED